MVFQSNPIFPPEEMGGVVWKQWREGERERMRKRREIGGKGRSRLPGKQRWAMEPVSLHVEDT